MRIDCAATLREAAEPLLRGRTAVVIDALRATTTMASLLAAGASRIWPVGDLEEARGLARELSRDPERKVLLAGERKGLPPEGFDLGNSPLRFDRERVRGSDVVLTTTNGTQAIERCRRAARLITASFVNMGAVVRQLLAWRPASIYVACAGTEGRFSLDDALAAGCLISRFSEHVSCSLSDGALAARALYERYAGDVETGLGLAAHAGALRAIGFDDDIRFAARIDALDVAPVRAGEERGASRFCAGRVVFIGVQAA